MKNHIPSNFIKSVAAALLLSAPAAAIYAGPGAQNWNRTTPVTTVKEAAAVNPEDTLIMKCDSCKKVVYKLPKTGMNLTRSSAGWINVEAVGTRLVVKFFDAKKKPMAPEVERGFARFIYAAKNNTDAVLTREGDTLATPATVRPPHNFVVILNFFSGESSEAVETYSFNYP